VASQDGRENKNDRFSSHKHSFSWPLLHHIDYLNPKLLQAFIQLTSSSHLELVDRISYLNPELLPHTEIIHVGFNEYRMAIYDLLADKDYYNGLHRHVRWQRVK